jgi:hypothetical protein
MHGYESVEHREFMPYLSKFPRQQWCRDDVLCLVFFHKFDVQAPEVHTQPLASGFVDMRIRNCYFMGFAIES